MKPSTIHHLLAIPALAAALTFAACEQVIEIELPEHTPQLVVNCTFSPDSVFIATVGISKHLQDTAQLQSPQDALIRILQDGQPFDTLRYDPNFFRPAYRGTRKPTAGRSYTVIATRPSMPEATGSSTLPMPPTIGTITRRDSVPGADQGATYTEITFTFNDPAGTDDYYIAAIQMRDSAEETPGNWVYYAYNLYAQTDDPIFENDFFGNQFSFADPTFDGSTYTIRLRCYTDDLQFGAPHVALGKVSKEYFLHSRTMNAYNESEFNPFAEPVIIHSNMTPGMGVFAGYTVTARPIPQ